MRKKFAVLGIASAMMMGLFAGCGSGSDEKANGSSENVNGVYNDVNDSSENVNGVYNDVNDKNKDTGSNDENAAEIVTEGVNSTGYALFKSMYSGSNICISPYSIEAAMAMITNGAENDTLKELMESLGINDVAGFNQAMKTVTDELHNDGATVDIANSLWSDGSVNKEFTTQLENYYSAETREVDFSDGETVDKINSWVSDATSGRIGKLLDRLDSQTKAVILNAVYFSGKFAVPFPKENTMEGRFFTRDGGRTGTDMMAIYDGEFHYYEGNGLKAVRLAYKDSDIVMDLYITDKDSNALNGEDAVDIYNSLTDEKKKEMYTSLAEGEERELVSLAMPKFEMESETVSLKSELMELGINKVFSDEAELDPMSENTSITDVIHKTYIKVDEEGTEAAGVTGGMAKVTSLPDAEMIRFIADQPFVYVISDSSTGVILFMGAITDPASTAK